METFEPGVQSAYSTHQFREGEEGMKCLRPGCPRVMTLSEWQEKRRCFCQSTDAVRAIARSERPTRISVSPNRPNPPISRPTPRTPVPATPLSITPNPPQYAWRWAGLLVLLLGLGGLTGPIVQFSQNRAARNANQATLDPQFTPKEVITRYYQLAPVNRTAAIALLSDDYKNYYKVNQSHENVKNFWNTIKKVDIYLFQTLSSASPDQSKVKVWLRYLTSDNITACESLIVELILDKNQGLWLIDKTSDVQQKPSCRQ
jgi:hypothetical protein